ncbi:MAG: hypothetical protein ABSG41_15520 [Bryobacteraceae bacterium]
MSTNKAEYARYANRSTPANATQTDSMAQLERDAKATSRSKTTNIYVGKSLGACEDRPSSIYV